MDRPASAPCERLIKAAKKLSRQCDQLCFADPVTHVYNPLNYAWKAHRAYLSMASASTEVVFLGMNPGPWGMAQTGVPFGEIDAVKNWLGIDVPVSKPDNEHPKRPIEGFQCTRSEVSGRRLWGLMQSRFGKPNAFLKQHFILNYCPLVFMESSARNRTPDKLPVDERKPLDDVCDQHLQTVLQILEPKHVVGVGAYAEQCLARALEQIGNQERKSPIQISRVLHPSPASPAANRGWAEQAEKQLCDAGIWS
ncbi:uracil-DNA glycosylase family protein [Stieleria varia]|uniref:Uracil DNA glycosylase superfamily protein n=1 Tax=Stieleria varia TaxID=2528005 RepID=A0A5C6AQ08_9BACT|nr:uracil-DNA glycosylase family protein [Stieleria varia]TWU02123.1 Uracil DNA glycosylase superfamily protein [Stieleria varia]